MKTQTDCIKPEILRIVLILAVMATLPHTLHLPIMLSLFFILLAIWRFISLTIPQLSPGRFFLGLLTITGVLLVYSQHQTLMGRDAGVSLLTIMLTLKLMELRKQRDIYVACFMSYFIIVTQFLFSQSFLLTLYLLCMVVCITALLLEINRTIPSRRLLEPLKSTLTITLQAIPIAAILFLLFPRISQPLWHLSFHTGSGLTGLDDRVSPGSISQLILSPAVAFRVKFFGQTPLPEERYWRGLVLWDSDGFEWFNQTAPKPSNQPPGLQDTEKSYRYEIQLEPHYKKWLYSLDLPATAPQGSRFTADYLLIANQSVNQPRKYQMVSHAGYLTERPAQNAMQRALATPDNVTQRQIDLVENWLRRSKNHAEVVRHALNYFNTQPYVYTLAPPLYLSNPIDEFLFEGKEGFCEHYAISFTQLMRTAGIPTRMVIGYQGGEYNPLGDYFIIRQSDAHAWTEVWLESIGWTRIDPTAAVAPERVRHAIQFDFSGIGSPVLFQIDGGGVLSSFLGHIDLVMDAANLSWRRWIIGYNRQHQSSLLNNFGFDFTKGWEWASLLAALIGLLLLLTTVFILLKGRLKVTPVVRSYHILCNKLARVGLPRRSSEGPLDFSKRVASARPDLSAQTQKLFGIYIRLRYAEATPRTAMLEFKRLVRGFRPRKYSG
ncbi:MAG: DUF3488 and transglutaminase-like domain-containing protein [Pseudomonadota bacterium]